MTRPRYIASCSGGKDSVATILLAAEKNEPLDEVIYSEVMFDQEISGEVPEHRDFIHQKLKRFVENELGCKFTVLRSDKTYDDVFHHIITRGPYISIHTTLAGGDSGSLRKYHLVFYFNPHHPRGWRHLDLIKQIRLYNFNPHHPRGWRRK